MALRFRAIDWSIRDVQVQGVPYMTAMIHCIGRNSAKESCCLNISDFSPKLYIKPIEEFTDTAFSTFLKKFKTHLYTEECHKVRLKDFYGFRGEETEQFYLLKFKNIKGFSALKWKLKNRVELGGKKYNLKTYNGNVDPLLQYFHENSIKPASSIEFTGKKSKQKYSTCQREWTVSADNVKSIESIDSDYVEATYDIETYSKDDSFPQPGIKENVITHIGMVCDGSEYLWSLHSDQSDKYTEHFVFDNEKDLLNSFLDFLMCKSPDVLYQYNGDRFDGNYIFQRMKRHNINPQKLSKLLDLPASIKESTFTSSAYGTTHFKRLIIPGMIHFDVMTYFSRNFKEDSYSLDHISKKYLNETKAPMTVKQMFESYRFRDYKSALEVGEYCVKDCVLPQKLIHKFNIFTAMQSMANVCHVPINYLLYRGQQIKAFSQISYFCRNKGYVIPDTTEVKDNGYEGATVLEPVSGLYTRPVIVLDFASLYPSIMRAHNLCYSSIVLDPEYLNLPGYTYDTFNDVTFVQNNDSVLPKLLEDMAQSRKSEKRKMAQSTGLQEQIHNMNQNAYKISMNSVYGFLAAQMLQCKPIASTVTFVGRQMILKTKELVEQNQGLKVVYGDTDSVFIEYNKGLCKDKELTAYGEDLASKVSEAFKRPILLEFEKFYRPLLIFSKKRYTGNQYTVKGDTITASVQSKGIVTNRRDNCPFLRSVYTDCLNTVLDSTGNYTENLEFKIKDYVSSLKKGLVDINDLIISKTLNDTYKTQNLPHVAVAAKMRKRNVDVQVNDRIPYIFVKTDNKRDPQYKKAEHPEYAIANRLPIDYDYYIQKQLRNPLQQLVETVFGLNPRYTRVLKKEKITPELQKRLDDAKIVNKLFDM